MIPMIKTEAIILRRRDLKERDKLLTLLTKSHGKQIVRAIGAKKIDSKLGGHLEPFMRTDVFLVNSKTIDIVAGAQVVDSFSGLRKSLPGLHAGQYLMEVVDKLTPEGQPEPRVYELLSSGLELLAQQSPINFLTVQSTVLQMLACLGFEPELDKCVQCGLPIEPGEYLFQVEIGGMVHRACATDSWLGEVVNFETVKALRFALRSSLEQISSLRLSSTTWQQLNTCIDQLVTAHSRSPIRSRAFLGQLV